jgi:hypothetical protein
LVGCIELTGKKGDEPEVGNDEGVPAVIEALEIISDG